MRTTKEILDTMMASDIVKSKGFSEETVQSLIDSYHDSVTKVLTENGYVQLSEDLRVEVVRLQKRKHVLRGQPYYNHRKYKLKTKMSYEYYERIAESFASFLED